MRTIVEKMISGVFPKTKKSRQHKVNGFLYQFKISITSMQPKQRRSWVRQQFREPAACKPRCDFRPKQLPNGNAKQPMVRW